MMDPTMEHATPEIPRLVEHLSLSFAACETESDLYRTAVMSMKEQLGFDRVAVFLYEGEHGEIRGTWGSDGSGNTVEESWYLSQLGPEKEFIRQALEAPDLMVVWDDRDLLYNDVPLGRGWNAMVKLMVRDRVYGWLAMDNLIRHRPMEPWQRDMAQVTARLLANFMLRLRHEVTLRTEVERKTSHLLAIEAELRRANEELRDQNALKERLFTIIAHDLRGPMGSLRNLLTLVCSFYKTLPPEELGAMLPDMKRSVDATYNLLENLLSWVRGQLSEINVLCVRAPLAPLLERVHGWVIGTAQAKGIEVSIVCPPQLTALVDERMVETIVRNLCGNAIKYSPAGGQVLVRASRNEDDDTVMIAVEDRGTGLTRAQLEGLFKAQGNSIPGTGGERGSGLGLMFSQDLARHLKGRIDVRSAEGEGSTFTLVLPDELEGDLDAPE